MTDQPSNAEIVRRLDDITKRIADLVAEVREDRRVQEATYVRKDVWSARHDEMVRDVVELKRARTKFEDQYDTDRDKDATRRRQFTNSLLGVALAVATLAVSVVALFVSRG